MALFRHRSSVPRSAHAQQPQAVLLRYAIGRRKLDLDRFTQLQQLLTARLQRLQLGTCTGETGDSQVSVVIAGQDCAQLWETTERAALLCPLVLVEVELRSGEPGAPSVRFPPPEQVDVELRPRLELTRTGGGVPQRRLIAFDLMHRIEQLEDGDGLSLAKLGNETCSVQCQRVGHSWLVIRSARSSSTREHVRMGTTDSALDVLLQWGATAPEPDLLTWTAGDPRHAPDAPSR